ncbi:phage terminase small subunit-related protein [Paenibacillus senegalimassiliensis]|uniref:phage terminase small subunit-related protein n=1 Tax=Paenibacillus senegalimassiliensis TaxID=1737426 RepID=UPI000AA2FDD5|nr:phage terminase small subunit-related protein [Paenibacillus senegalimassiliensis]
MARERSPERDKAKQMWIESIGTMKLKDIAAALTIGETQVRKWKSQDKWAAELNTNVTNESKGNVTKRGAPKGNKNAVGNRGGAPPGNQNAKGNRGGKGGPAGNKKAVTTGEYESIWMDALEEDEQELVDQIDTDPVQQADEAIRLLTIRERRMLQRISKLMNGLTEKQRRLLQELNYSSPGVNHLIVLI